MRMTDRGAVQCGCVLQRSAAVRLERAGIPPRYQTRTLDTFDRSVSRSAAGGLTIAREFVKSFPAQRDLGLLLTGPVGIGKTHLAIGILLACHQQWAVTVRFVELRDLFSQIKDTFNAGDDRSEMGILRPLLECDLLVIDEVGAARDTDWQRETTEKLINGRYNANLATVCTTNYSNHPPAWRPNVTAIRKDSAAGFSGRTQDAHTALRTDTLGDRIGAAMWSRLQEMCKCVAMDGEDQRTARRKA